MSAAIDVMELLPRLRQGDQAAQAAFYREFEPEMRREVRLRVRFDQHFRRLFESMDIYQEVMNSFFQRTQRGEYELNDPPQIYALLKTMVRHKVSKKRRWLQAEHRKEYRHQDLSPQHWQLLPGDDPSLSRLVSEQELLSQVMARLTDAERPLAELRLAGHSWAEIAERCGGSPDSCRMKLNRALTEALREMGQGNC